MTASRKLDEVAIQYKKTNSDESFLELVTMLDAFIARECQYAYRTIRHSSWFRSLSFNDLRQELLIHLRCTLERWDRELGASFFTYYYTSKPRFHLIQRVIPKYRHVLSTDFQSRGESQSPLRNRLYRMEFTTEGPGKSEWNVDIPVIDTRFDALEVSEISSLLISLSESVLDERQRDILWRRIDGETLISISEYYEITKERVRQIENQSIEKLKNAWIAHQSLGAIE